MNEENRKLKHQLTVYQLIGAKVAYYRRLNGYSQQELAEEVHINRSVIARIESGIYNSNIPLNLLFLLAESLHVEAAVLITFDAIDLQFLKDKGNAGCEK